MCVQRSGDAGKASSFNDRSVTDVCVCKDQEMLGRQNFKFHFHSKLLSNQAETFKIHKILAMYFRKIFGMHPHRLFN